jgi:deoxyuridine 5'-triphosphate nucleotidohydrolase
MESIVGQLYSKLHVWHNGIEFEGCVCVETESDADCIADLVSKHCNVKSEVGEIVEENVILKGTDSDYYVSWSGPDVISVVHHMYLIIGDRVLTRFGVVLHKLNPCHFAVCKEGAVVPSKAHQSDTGFDLTVIDVVKRIDEKTALYGTGIKAIPPAGYYFEIVPRSSISKTGYILSNNIGIIDQSYRGELLVALTKIQPNAPDIKLPCRIAQLIPREYIHLIPTVVPEESISDTSRGGGGFGSSGEK